MATATSNQPMAKMPDYSPLEMEMARQADVIERTVYLNPYIPKIDKWVNGKHVEFPSRKQTRFLAYDGQEALFGGAAGSGKSRILLACALQYVEHPGYAALILRRTYKQLMMAGGLIPMSQQWLVGKAHWSADQKEWTFPSGATLKFGYYDNDNHFMNFQGGAWDTICFDELTQFKENWYRYLFSRLRRLEGSPIPMRVRATSNPGGPSHEFVKKRFVVPGAKKYFVPALIDDNAGLDKIAYVQSLAELDPITRAQLLQGDWNAYTGGRFSRDWFLGADGNRGWWMRQDRSGNSYYCWTGCPAGGVPVALAWTAITCDPASRAEEVNDPTAIGVFAVLPGGQILVLEVVREWLPVQEIMPRIAGLCAVHQPLFVGIEDSGFQVTLINEARQCPGIPTVVALQPEGKSKLVRARPAIIRASNGEIFVPRDTNAFAWIEDFISELCLAKGTRILTMSGDKPIEKVVIGDFVMTRIGWRRVRESRQTGVKKLCQIDTDKGQRLLATLNHPILVPACGFIPAGALKVGDGLLRFTGVMPIYATRTQKTVISAEHSPTGKFCCTGLFGNQKRGVQFLTASSSITSMGMSTTMLSAILNARPKANTSLITDPQCAWRHTRIRYVSCAATHIKQRSLGGQEHAPSRAGIEMRTQEGKNEFTSVFARHVQQSFVLIKTAPNIAAKNVLGLLGKSTEYCRLRCVSGAKLIFNQSPRHEHFAADVAVSSIRMLAEERPVFNLEVEDFNEFVAEGLLVHNSQFTGDEKLDSHDDQVDILAYFVQQVDRGGLSMPSIITPEQAQNELRNSGHGGIFMSG